MVLESRSWDVRMFQAVVVAVAVVVLMLHSQPLPTILTLLWSHHYKLADHCRYLNCRRLIHRCRLDLVAMILGKKKLELVLSSFGLKKSLKIFSINKLNPRGFALDKKNNFFSHISNNSFKVGINRERNAPFTIKLKRSGRKKNEKEEQTWRYEKKGFLPDPLTLHVTALLNVVIAASAAFSECIPSKGFLSIEIAITFLWLYNWSRNH